jgi:two-component system C4-dicarboxylate transport response regulator DctD
MNEIRKRVLIVDDDREIRESLSYYFNSVGWSPQTAKSGDDALKTIRNELPDVVISDIRMPGMDGQDLLLRIKQLAPDLPVVMITAHGDVPAAIEAMKAGAVDFIEKPYDPEDVVQAAMQVVEDARSRERNANLRKRLLGARGLEAVLIGDSPEMAQLRQNVADMADTDASVLIIGETGTGKEVVAQALHDISSRSKGPFIPVNCAAVTDELFDAAMFGHRAGAFTGATQASPGFFVAADNGSLFLDELSACSQTTQPKLLRALESRQVTPVGEARPHPVNVRIICASNENLEERIARGSFRADLYYRVNTLILQIPPLRQRLDDILPLFTYFLMRFAKDYGINPPELTTADISTLFNHDWPGNVRELCHVAERRVLAARRGRDSVGEAMSLLSAEASSPEQTLKEKVEAFERQIIARVLEDCDGSMDDVANLLGIARRTLNEKLARYGLRRD